MDNVTFHDAVDNLTNTTTTYALIDHGNNEFTSMLKSTYDAMQSTQGVNQNLTGTGE